jgi:hypothetical protein
MDTELLVEPREEDGRDLLAQLARDEFDVTVALWAKPSEDGRWRLYIASPLVDPAKRGQAHVAVFDSLRKLPGLAFSLSDIRMIPATSPTAIAAKALRDRRPGRRPIRVRGDRLLDIPAEEVYIYPSMKGPMTRDEVMEAVLGLMKRAGSVQPSTVTLRDGVAVHAIPIGMEVHTPNGVQITLLDVDTNTRRAVSADDVVNIH